MATTMTDNDLIALAHERYSRSKILEAHRMLQKVGNQSLFGEKEHEMMQYGAECHNAIADLLDEPDHTSSGSVWKKQGESHGEYDTDIYYKVENRHLTCRVVTPIGADLLVPLVSVLNESNLYTDWIPSWTIPFTMGIGTSNQYRRIGKLDQIVHLIANVPWPFLPREVYIQTMVIDEIDENSYFAVRLFSLEADENETNIPKPSSKVQRFDFQGVLLFRPCPKSDTNKTNSKLKTKSSQTNNTDQMIEVSFKMWVDPKISVVPTKIINFVTRTVIGTIWGQLLHVAKQVQDGERTNHIHSIQRQPELYQFIEQRVQAMLLSSHHPVTSEKQPETPCDDNEIDKKDFQIISYLQS